MLVDLFPRVHQHFLSLPVLGPAMEGFAGFLVERGYPVGPVRRHLCTAREVDRRLQRRGSRTIAGITRAALRKCGPPIGRSQDDALIASTLRLLEAYLDGTGVFPASASVLSPAAAKVSDYGRYLEQVRGLAARTIRAHLVTAGEFLARVCGSRGLGELSGLRPTEVEEFVRLNGQRLSRESLQHVVAQLRSFLRYLAVRGDAPGGLDGQIDTPRIYRGERLPRALPWETVTRLLASIDRTTPLGRRDHAMFLLIATYGLRASEITRLRLDDIEWRSRRLCVFQRKTAAPLELPLTDEVATSLVMYLRRGRPAVPYREVFVRHRAPAGVLKPTAVTEAFQSWSRRSGLGIKSQGPHCLRHSYAVRLLRKGVPLKTIGDVLGHRTMESTCVYLRLAVEDLRGVALDLPDAARLGRQR